MKRKIIFIGNSIVNGFPYSRGKSFPGLVRAALKDGRAGFHAEIINKGNNGETTAQNGKWVEAPGENFFTMLEATLGYHMPIIAEDLGEIEVIRKDEEL